MMSRMYGQTMNQGYLEVLKPIKTTNEAVAAIQAFLDATRSNLEITTVWEYKTAFKAELSDTKGQKAFDILADKLTGAVTPEMGFNMMMNASWGSALHKTRNFGAKLVLTPQDAIAAAEAFLAKNAAVLDYTLTDPETYPGYYKFHTADAAGKPGVDIMVNGYNGRIWMNTLLGAPIAEPVTP